MRNQVNSLETDPMNFQSKISNRNWNCYEKSVVIKSILKSNIFQNFDYIYLYVVNSLDCNWTLFNSGTSLNLELNKLMINFLLRAWAKKHVQTKAKFKCKLQVKKHF